MNGARAASILVTQAAVFLSLAAASGDTRGVRIDFITPRHLQTVLGDTEIRLRVSAPGKAAVERVDVLADGVIVGSLRKPPWTVRWDAGESGGAHRLEAILHLSEGTSQRTAIRTSPLRITQFEEVALVNLYAVVRDREGKYVSYLNKGDFRLTENGRPEIIDRFSTEEKPLRVAIVLDTSLTMEGAKLDAARKAALGFLEVLNEGDEGIVVSFNDEVHVLQELTSDRQALAAALESVEARGGTALYDSIWRTSRQLARFDGRRVLVLLSDGRDEAASGLEPGSLHTLEEALDRALRDEVIIFPIGFGRGLSEATDFYGRRTLESILEEMATQTGGRALFPGRAGRLKSAFEAVADDLRHMYSMAYVSDDDRADGGWREIRLTTEEPGFKVYTRKGYFAPSEEERTANAGAF